jgi:hypothetical protein
MTNFPLTWPAGWRRTKEPRDAAFKHERRALSVWDGYQRVKEELRMLGAVPESIIISTNIEVRKDGFPRSDRGEPADRGVAVYWKTNAKDPIHKVMPIDHYHRVADNLAAVAACLWSIRAMERHGGSFIVERAFTGFLALPAPNTWRNVFGLEAEGQPTLAEVRVMFKHRAKTAHQDNGGTDAQMSELNWAMKEAERELS